ncbi:hypothetical protein H310_08130 [Aphanomyces invadans]|uniref:Centromere protein X n=1 Tax=Aphanomyces invadans TaxID=157072 RepID=A0A024TZM2_9STRA|nr:hypothetical protein H310_08130 [Aphanomyces invadans]ETV99438.1 hypothetical protein H310_08130 [Aphanomyces invadans]|eukprot:XP_008871994.1 hypothetical protein H310_08130 [Aphanomyces invadans]
MDAAGNEHSRTAAGFKPKLIERIVHNVWESAHQERDAIYESKDDGDSSADDILSDVRSITRIQSDALKMTAELMRLFVLDALHRAQEEAMIEDSTQVESRHVEQILALLLLDF